MNNDCDISKKKKTITSNEISSEACAVYFLTEYAAATAGVFIAQ